MTCEICKKNATHCFATVLCVKYACAEHLAQVKALHGDRVVFEVPIGMVESHPITKQLVKPKRRWFRW